MGWALVGTCAVVPSTAPASRASPSRQRAPAGLQQDSIIQGVPSPIEIFLRCLSVEISFFLVWPFLLPPVRLWHCRNWCTRNFSIITFSSSLAACPLAIFFFSPVIDPSVAANRSGPLFPSPTWLPVCQCTCVKLNESVFPFSFQQQRQADNTSDIARGPTHLEGLPVHLGEHRGIHIPLRSEQYAQKRPVGCEEIAATLYYDANKPVITSVRPLGHIAARGLPGVLYY